MMPFYIGGYWTIPILPINKELYKQKWNKPLAMIQSFLIPIVVSLLRNSNDVTNSNFVVEQKIKYHWPRKIYYSDNERILASSFKMIIVIRREMVDHEKQTVNSTPRNIIFGPNQVYAGRRHPRRPRFSRTSLTFKDENEGFIDPGRLRRQSPV